MNAIIQEKLQDLEQLCEKHRVARLHLFGSAARGDFDPGASDLDFLVEPGIPFVVAPRRGAGM